MKHNLEDNKKIQKALRGFGLYWGGIDGILGPKAIKAIKEFQGIHNLTQDGVVGPRTLAELFVEPFADREDSRGIENVGEFPSQSDVRKFYGAVGRNQAKVRLPYPMKLAWDTSTKIRRFSCHSKVVERMGAIFEATLDHYGKEAVAELGLDLFGGCLNVRKMRGGSKYSMHSWGIAVDLDPKRNQLRWDHTKANFAKPEYIPFWDIIEKNGATSLGRSKDYDWMHFQFAGL